MSMNDDRCVDSNGHPERYQQVDYSKWILHLLTWDGLVTAMMLSLPFLVRRFGPPNNDRFLVMVVVAALIVGVLVRFSLGMRYVRSNYCREGVKLLQRAGLLSMISLLVLVETLLCVIPPAGLKGPDFVFFAVLGAAYLGVMAFVLYPGRREFRSSDCNQ